MEFVVSSSGAGAGAGAGAGTGTTGATGARVGAPSTRVGYWCRDDE